MKATRRSEPMTSGPRRQHKRRSNPFDSVQPNHSKRSCRVQTQQKQQTIVGYHIYCIQSLFFLSRACTNFDWVGVPNVVAQKNKITAGRAHQGPVNHKKQEMNQNHPKTANSSFCTECNPLPSEAFRASVSHRSVDTIRLLVCVSCVTTVLLLHIYIKYIQYIMYT